MNIRMTPPADPQKYATFGTMSVNGRTYTAAQGSTLDVPDFDGEKLAANGWLKLGPVGPTGARPTYDGRPVSWINAVTGAGV